MGNGCDYMPPLELLLGESRGRNRGHGVHQLTGVHSATRFKRGRRRPIGHAPAERVITLVLVSLDHQRHLLLSVAGVAATRHRGRLLLQLLQGIRL